MSPGRRAYNQACPLAFSLDLIGERWTLLIVRDLLLGPLRFSDLLQRLPGIGRNLLTTRLKDLEAEQIVAHRKLAPPAGAMVYELTDKGQQLEPTLLALSAWALRHVPPQRYASGHPSPDLAAMGFKLAFDPDRAAGRREVHQFVAHGVPFFMRVGGEEVSGHRGRSEEALFCLEADGLTFATMLGTRRLELSDGLARDTIRIEGGRRAVRRGLALYGIRAR